MKNLQNTRCVNIGCEEKISKNGDRNLKMNKKTERRAQQPCVLVSIREAAARLSC